MKSVNRLAVKLNSAAEKKVKQGHPWVFSDSIEKINSSPKSGDLAILFEKKGNKIYGIGLYDADSPIRIKIIHSGGPITIDESFFHQKIHQAFSLRKPLLNTKTNAYRLIFGENDGFPGLIVDVYNRIAVLKLYSASWLPYLDSIATGVLEIVQLEGIILRLSRNLQLLDLELKEGAIIAGKIDGSTVFFQEYGVHFQADLIQGHKTGFFLDHRENRHKIGKMTKGKTVLDVFSYAGGFSVHALASGAKEVYSLDFSFPALKLAKKNAQLNDNSGKHHLLVGDAFVLLEELVADGKQFDIVVIDPPSFAKSEKEIQLALEKYAILARLGISLTAKNGILMLASCSSRVEKEDFYEIHREELRRAGRKYEVLETTEHAIDHPILFKEAAYLKAIYYRIG